MAISVLALSRPEYKISIEDLLKMNLNLEACTLSDKDKSIIIENILLRIEVPTLYFYMRAVGSGVLLEPLNETANNIISVIRSFMNNEFKITYADVIEGLRGNVFCGLPRYLARRLEEANIKLVFFDTNMTEEELSLVKRRLKYYG